MPRKDTSRQHWKKVKDNLHKVQIILIEKKSPPTADIWWARNVLQCLICNPIPRLKSEVKKNENFLDYRPIARAMLEKLDERWPIAEFPERNGEVKKYTSVHARLVTESALRGVKKKLQQVRNKLKYWEPRYGKLALCDKRWRETHDKVNELRKEITYLETRVQQLTEKL